MDNSTIRTNIRFDDTRLLGEFEPGSQEWLDLRRNGVTGSDASVVLGINPWTSPFTLWGRKTGKIEETRGQSEAMEWGSRLESVIAEKFCENHPELDVALDVGTWCSVSRPWMIANPDGIIAEDGRIGILEIKTAQFEDDFRDGPPPYYVAQVQWYMAIFNAEFAHFAVLFHGNKYREFVVEADTLLQDAIIFRAQEFMDYVRDERQPDWDGSLSTYSTVRELNPNIDVAGEAEIDESLERSYFEAKADLASAEAMFNAIKSEILDTMGMAQRGFVNGEWRFSRTSRNGGLPYLAEKRG